MATTKALTGHHIQLARQLPPRLLNFFQKFPPAAVLQAAPATATESTSASTATEIAAEAPTTSQELPYHNPFQPRKNFVTGKWVGPRYGLRRQAELCKLARKYHVEELLPYSIKKSGEKEKRRLERGLQVKGTGVGEKVKGHAWERKLPAKLEKRKEAMLKMPEMIQQWKQRGHGRGWKKWPK